MRKYFVANYIRIFGYIVCGVIFILIGNWVCTFITIFGVGCECILIKNKMLYLSKMEKVNKKISWTTYL